eukprot:gene4606-5641_t
MRLAASEVKGTAIVDAGTKVTQFGGALWSPVPHVDASGRLHLFYTESEGDCRRRSKPKSKWPPGGSIKASITKAVWIQNHGNNTASQWKRQNEGVTNGKWKIHQGLRYHHTVSLARLASGSVYAAWQAAEDTEGESDQHIRMSVSRDGAKGWKQSWRLNAHCRVKDVVKEGQKATNHAVPYASGLFSQDGGRTWESRGKLHDAAYPDADGWALDTKTTWLIENSVVELSNGDLKMYFRTHAGFIYQAQSSDKGMTWTEPVPTSIQNPDSKSQVVRLKPSGPLLMVFNDHKRGIIRSNHTDVKMAVCLDQEPNPNSVWTEPRTIYGIEEDGWIPKMLSNKLVVLSSGEWVLPFWRENAMLAKGTWPDKQLPNKCVTLLSLAISEDDGNSWRRIGVLRGGVAPGLRFHYPWILQMGCKVLVAYSKFYVTGFKYQENDRELGLRAVHVHL